MFDQCKSCHYANLYPTGICAECLASDNFIHHEASDPVYSPSHYTQGGIECIDAIEAAVTGLTGMDAVCTAQVIKYMWRWKHKNGLEDLKKARWYLGRLIEAYIAD